MSKNKDFLKVVGGKQELEKKELSQLEMVLPHLGTVSIIAHSCCLGGVQLLAVKKLTPDDVHKMAISTQRVTMFEGKPCLYYAGQSVHLPKFQKLLGITLKFKVDRALAALKKTITRLDRDTGKANNVIEQLNNR